MLISGPDGQAIDGGGHSASCCSSFCDPKRSRHAAWFFPFRTVAKHRREPNLRAGSSARILLGYWEDSSFFAVGQAARAAPSNGPALRQAGGGRGPMAAPDDRPRPGREPTITLEAKAWLTSLSCREAKELGYPHELWTTRLLTPHAREHGPAEGHPCLANTKMAVARVAAPDWSYAGSRGGGANPRHRASGCRRHTVGLRYRACASAGHRNREHRQPQ